MGKALNEQLIIAIRQDDIHKASKLLSSGADINAKDKGSFTCLDWAIAFGNDEMIEMLMQKGADDSNERIAGFMACQSAFSDKLFGSLIYAISQGSVSIALELLRSGVSTEGKTEKEKALLSDVLAKSFIDDNINKKDIETFGSFSGMRKFVIAAYQKSRKHSAKKPLKKSGSKKQTAPAGKKKKQTKTKKKKKKK